MTLKTSIHTSEGGRRRKGRIEQGVGKEFCSIGNHIYVFILQKVVSKIPVMQHFIKESIKESKALSS